MLKPSPFFRHLATVQEESYLVIVHDNAKVELRNRPCWCSSSGSLDSLEVTRRGSRTRSRERRWICEASPLQPRQPSRSWITTTNRSRWEDSRRSCQPMFDQSLQLPTSASFRSLRLSSMTEDYGLLFPVQKTGV